MSSLKDKLLKIKSKNVQSSLMSSTDFGDPEHIAPMHQYIFNLILSGKIRGEGAGIPPGIVVSAGASKTSKTAIGLNAVKAYLDHYPASVCLFYDSEFSPKSMWTNIGVDLDRIIHIPVFSVEGVRSDLVQKLSELKSGERVIIFWDSLGLTASSKEVDDAQTDSQKKDMSRPSAIKSMFRMITPRISYCNIPAVIVNHTGLAVGELFPTEKQTGGQATELAPNTVMFFGKSKLKDDASDNSVDHGRSGNLFKVKINKSRTIKEGSVFDVPWRYGENAFNKYAGLYSLALKTGDIYTPSKGYRSPLIVDEDGVIDENPPKFREKDIELDPDFWEDIMFEKTNFIKNAEELYNY